MGVVINPNSELGRELAKWEQHHTMYTMGQDDNGNPISPGNPYRYRAFPSMLYKATERQGKIVCLLPAPHPHEFEKMEQFERAVHQCETWNAAAMKVVHNEDEMARLKNEGWRESPTDAMDALEQRRQAVSNAAAETAFHAQRMTAQARAELADADASTSAHVVDVLPKRSHHGKAAKGVTAVSE